MIGISAIGSFLHGIRNAGARAARATMEQISALTGGHGGLDAGKLNRLNKYRQVGSISPNNLPTDQIQRCRWQAWELHRNNPHARKIVNALLSKVVGCGLHPQSHAVDSDGVPHMAFRARAKKLWEAINSGFDYRGRPGQGGLSRAGLERMALQSTILSGETLYRLKPITTREQLKRGLPIPLVLQLIHPERLDENQLLARAPTSPDNRIYRGIEVDSDGQRVAYWLLPNHPGDFIIGTFGESKPIAASEIGHIYISDDIDQLRGLSWFAPAILQLRDTGDYQYNELISSAIGACVALVYKASSPGGTLGLQLPSDGDTTDANGNQITAFTPGMVVRSDDPDKVKMLSPGRPSTSAADFINHLMRSTATALPGTKSSTITGDYRNSSFSSEKSADNDAWPEIEALQHWLASGFHQPIYEQVIDAGIESGYFDGVITASEYMRRRSELICASWQGPVARSINPVDDAKAAKERIKNGTSTPQIEAAMIGRNWQEILQGVAEFREYAESLDIDEEYIDQCLGIDTTQTISETDTADAADMVDTADPSQESSDETAKPQIAAAA